MRIIPSCKVKDTKQWVANNCAVSEDRIESRVLKFYQLMIQLRFLAAKRKTSKIPSWSLLIEETEPTIEEIKGARFIVLNKACKRKIKKYPEYPWDLNLVAVMEVIPAIAGPNSIDKERNRNTSMKGFILHICQHTFMWICQHELSGLWLVEDVKCTSIPHCHLM